MVDVKIEPSWKELLKDEFEKPYFSELIQFVKNEYTRYLFLWDVPEFISIMNG